MFQVLSLKQLRTHPTVTIPTIVYSGFFCFWYRYGETL